MKMLTLAFCILVLAHGIPGLGADVRSVNETSGGVARGRVVDENGRAVAGASVVLGFGEKSKTVITDRSGRFKLEYPREKWDAHINQHPSQKRQLRFAASHLVTGRETREEASGVWRPRTISSSYPSIPRQAQSPVHPSGFPDT